MEIAHRLRLSPAAVACGSVTGPARAQRVRDRCIWARLVRCLDRRRSTPHRM